LNREKLGKDEHGQDITCWSKERLDAFKGGIERGLFFRKNILRKSRTTIRPALDLCLFFWDFVYDKRLPLVKANASVALTKIPAAAMIQVTIFPSEPKPVFGSFGVGGGVTMGIEAGRTTTFATAMSVTVNPLELPAAVAVFVVVAFRFCLQV